MGRRALGAWLCLGVLLTGCSTESEQGADAPSLNPQIVDVPTYDPSLQPAAAVLALVPADDTDLLVSDYTQMRLQLGFPDLSSASPAAQRARFWQRANRAIPQMTPGLLRSDDAALIRRFGFGADDVAWEATFIGDAGPGWAIKLRDDLDDAGVTRAVKQGFGVLKGAAYYTSTHVILHGGTTDPTRSWRADPLLTSLVGQQATGTYVSSRCLPFDTAFGPGLRDQLAPAPAADLATLAPLEAFSVAFSEDLVTARVGEDREDAFARADLAGEMPATEPDFGAGFTAPLADPAGGQLGYNLGDPATASALVHAQHLPFAVCAE